MNESKFLIESLPFYTILAKSHVEGQNKKASMMILSKEASNKDVKIKIQMIISMTDSKEESSTEQVWKENGFFNDQRTDLTIVKANFPENTFVYVNNGTITSIKGGRAMYINFVILAQIMPVANPPSDLNLATYKFQENEVLIFTPLYNAENGLYRGLTKNWDILL